VIEVDLALTVEGAGTDPFSARAALSVADGETLVVLGPSGSGKSLLLEAIAGVRDASGSVTVDSRDVTEQPPEARGLGYVFQEYALFPHRTVLENVAFGTRYHESTREPMAVLDDLGVADLAERSPDTLSGGESQRVALARSLVIRPDAFLLDEPLAALDAPTRADLRGVLADTLADETAIYVTHDRTTARALGDRVAVLDRGRPRQIGSVEAIFERPASPFVARFTGANCLAHRTMPASLQARFPDATHVAIRPEHVRITEEDSGAGIRGAVLRAIREETAHRVTVKRADCRIDVLTDRPPSAESVAIAFPGEHCHPIEADEPGQDDQSVL
jgi:ABC-type sugar transport system ATPase subunit